MKEEDVSKLKTVKDYVLMKGDLYRRMPGGILSRCMGHEEPQRKRKFTAGLVGFAIRLACTEGYRKRASIGQI